jgi:hypothetical protein
MTRTPSSIKINKVRPGAWRTLLRYLVWKIEREKSENPSFTSNNFFQVQGRKTQVMPYAVTDEFSEKWLKSIIFTSFTELQESLLK